MELNSIFYEESYSEAYNYAKENNYTIVEIEADENGRRFKISQKTDFEALNEIEALKAMLRKYKEDVEQVELFGMQRDDLEYKKGQCASIIERLRELEKLM